MQKELDQHAQEEKVIKKERDYLVSQARTRASSLRVTRDKDNRSFRSKTFQLRGWVSKDGEVGLSMDVPQEVAVEVLEVLHGYASANQL